MEIKWIEDFIALAQYQSFSRAAEFRNVTQSGFSRRIQSLEQWVGAELIDRSSFPPVLTPAGQLFREVAEDILARLFDTRAIIRTEQRIAGKSLQICAGHTIALNFLPTWLKALAPQFGEVRARVIPTNVHDSILMLVNGNCELMFAYHHPELPLHLDPARYEHVTVGLDTLMPASRPNERAGPKFRLPGTKQRPLPLISYTETSYFGRCQALLLKRTSDALSLRLHYESDMAEVLKKLVMEGEGVAWLPRSTIARELADGELVPAGPANWQLQIELRAYRDSTNRSEFLDTLWHHLGAGAAALE
ncbi:LysR substrate-binding domain-containing protein [Paraburkholderia sp. DD10]|uniref:LysR substrate-binding domain-containing protein n=1 Tax=Paraburkholderia sp. DD10 TaxID=3409691 RepID=UPI003B9FB348